jgi:hypothetical protein
MRKLLVAAALTAMTLLPAAARAGFILEASAGEGYRVAPSGNPGWDPLNLEISPGYAPSFPVLSMFRLQLGVVVDFPNTSGSSTNMQLRPMLTFVPPVIPLYVRAIMATANLFKNNGNGVEWRYGGALGVKVGLPSVAFIPALGIFAEAAVIGGNRNFPTKDANANPVKKADSAWAIQGRAGAYLLF